MRATAYHARRHLSEADLHPPARLCPLCRFPAVRTPVVRIQDDPLVELLRCCNCHGASASRMPHADVLDAYYASYYEGTELKTTSADPGRFARAITRYAPAPPRGGEVAILDFGGGDGTVGVAVAAERLTAGAGSARLEVVDYEPPRAVPSPAIAVTGHRDLDDASGRFDVIIASAVLEHVPDFHTTFLRLFRRVAPGGVLYVRTPWLAPFRRAPGGLDLTFPAHVHDLGGAFWNAAVHTYGLDAAVLRSGPSPVEADLRTHPARAVPAAVLKLPARAEARLRPTGTHAPWWRWVGGWEAVLRVTTPHRRRRRPGP